MKLPLSWIKDYVDITEDIDTLCKKKWLTSVWR